MINIQNMLNIQNMRNIQNMSIEELLANNGFKRVGGELARIDDINSTRCSTCGMINTPSLKTMTVTCPSVTIPVQATAPVTTVTVAFLSQFASIDSPSGWKDYVNISYTTGDGWGIQPGMAIYVDGVQLLAISRIPNTTATHIDSLPATGASYVICVGIADTPDVKCATYTSSIVAANVTCTSAPAPTSPSLSEIDIDFTWTNTGGTSTTFTPAISINGGALINLTASPVALAPGATYNVVKMITGLSLSPGTTYTVCPSPN